MKLIDTDDIVIDFESNEIYDPLNILIGLSHEERKYKLPSFDYNYEQRSRNYTDDLSIYMSCVNGIEQYLRKLCNNKTEDLNKIIYRLYKIHLYYRYDDYTDIIYWEFFKTLRKIQFTPGKFNREDYVNRLLFYDEMIDRSYGEIFDPLAKKNMEAVVIVLKLIIKYMDVTINYNSVVEICNLKTTSKNNSVINIVINKFLLEINDNVTYSSDDFYNNICYIYFSAYAAAKGSS